MKAVVAGALTRPATERADYVSLQCGDDATFRQEVESLLDASLRADALYEQPTLLIEGAPLTVDAFESIPTISPDVLRFEGTRCTRVATPFQGTSRYVVRRQIGTGGMGAVYEVHDRVRGQVVALKTILHWDSGDLRRLKREFRSLADVAHPNLVSLYDLVVDDERCFFTMELIEGVTFVDYVRAGSGPLDYGRLRRLVPQLVAGVSELHGRGKLHRDVKPANVLVTPDERLVILDFGLTSHLRRPSVRERDVAGTPAYLSPEQCLGGELTEASDWYSVGATLYHALTGRPPHEGSLPDIIRFWSVTSPAIPREIAGDVAAADLVDICAGLLRRDPQTRLTGSDVLARLQHESVADANRHPVELQPSYPESVFVGRATQLAMLDRAFDEVTRGRSTVVLVHGPSGIGKSALVQQFIDRRLGTEPALVLRSRCHEHESIPYKALDAIVDGIAGHLLTLPSGVLAQTIPPDFAALIRLFPVLGALCATPERERDASDPIQLRVRAFEAFRLLLAHVGRQQPVVIDIDDFHWTDGDSLRWLTDVLRPPRPSSLLVLISFRSEELDAKPFLRSLIERIDVGERIVLPVGPMSRQEVDSMIETLTPAARAADAGSAQEILRSSSGNPFLVEALARHIALGANADRGATLDDMLKKRLETLPPEARPFLEAVAVCGRPVIAARAFEAAGCRGDDRPLVARLRAAHLLRNSHSSEKIEMYHDRIRDAFVAQVPAAAARQIHEIMARLLAAHGDDHPEALFEHHRAAGRTALAADQAAAAAAKASAVLAFDLAATFYRHALTLQPQSAHRHAWSVGLARAIENAGRPVEAAEAYLEAAAQTTSTDHVQWRLKAAELFLIGGEIDRGLAVSSEILGIVGMRLASGPRKAMVSLACRRLQLRWRGLDFTPRHAAQIPSDDLLCIDACWAICAGLAMVDPIRAAAFNVRQLLRALDGGDPYRVARAMALEAGFSLVGTGAGRRRSEAFSRRAEELATQGGGEYVVALTTLWEGIAAFLTGQWKKASDLCSRAVTVLRDQCTGVTWELNMAHNFFLGGLVSQGELREVARHLPPLLASARERGNFYLELELHTRMILVWLAADDPDEADRRGNEGIARWSQRGFQRQHYSHMLMRVQTELYRGRPHEAWQTIERRERALRHSLFRRVQHTRIELANYRARCALARMAAGEERGPMRRAALRDIRRLERENVPWSCAFAQLLRATLAHLDGDIDGAVAELAGAVNAFGAAGMQLYAAVSRRRLGSLVGGDSGHTLRLEADRWMATQEIRNPEAMIRLIAPGFTD